MYTAMHDSSGIHEFRDFAATGAGRQQLRAHGSQPALDVSAEAQWHLHTTHSHADFSTTQLLHHTYSTGQTSLPATAAYAKDSSTVSPITVQHACTDHNSTTTSNAYIHTYTATRQPTHSLQAENASQTSNMHALAMAHSPSTRHCTLTTTTQPRPAHDDSARHTQSHT